MSNLVRLGFLASGRGSNMQAIVDACQSNKLLAEPAVVISNNSKSGALAKAKACNIPRYHLSSKTHPNRKDLDNAIVATLQSHNVDYVILAGYMKRLEPRTISTYRGKILNIHPALLPKFGGQGMYGHRVHEAVLASGETETGVTVHIVDGDYDTGSIVAQCRVPVLSNDDVDSLASRVLAQEHRFFVETLAKIISGQIVLP